MATAGPIEYTPVRADRGKVVHALALTTSKAACGKKRPRGGYRIANLPLTCDACNRLLGLRVRRGAKPVARTEVTS